MGDGYTDHCPKCLWGNMSIGRFRGDRESECRGLMEPVRAVYEREKFRIFYRCIKCGHEFGVRAAVLELWRAKGQRGG